MGMKIIYAGDDAALSAHGKAALPALLLALALDDDGVDEFIKPLVHVDDDGAAQDSDLRRGEPRALLFADGLLHIV